MFARAWCQAHVNAFARGMLELGYKRGTTIALWMANDVEHVRLFLCPRGVLGHASVLWALRRTGRASHDARLFYD